MEKNMNNDYKQAADIIKKSSSTIALTGAGISVESGIPDFRSAGGLWDKYDPAIYASINTFCKDPEKVWDMIFDMIDLTEGAKPNKGHAALAKLENMKLLDAIITQNIDNLHQAAGNKNVIEYHGNASRLQCIKCGARFNLDEFKISEKKVPRCSDCSSILKPSIIFFGEPIPVNALNDSEKLAEKAETVLVIGTSAIVYPAAGIPITAKKNGAKIIEFNLEETGFTGSITDIFIQGSAGVTLPEIVNLCLQ